MKCYKKLLVVFLIIVQLIASVSFVFAKDARNNEETIATFDDYVDWLQNESRASEDAGDTKKAEQTEQFLTQLEELPLKNRDEFMERLYKPETWEIVSSGGAYETGPMRGYGDYWWMHAWGYKDFYLFNISLARIQQEIKFYHYYGQRIDRIYYNDAFVVYNYHPSAGFSFYNTKYTSNNNTQANADTRISASFNFPGISITTHTFYGTIWGNVYNNYGYSFW